MFELKNTLKLTFLVGALILSFVLLAGVELEFGGVTIRGEWLFFLTIGVVVLACFIGAKRPHCISCGKAKLWGGHWVELKQEDLYVGAGWICDVCFEKKEVEAAEKPKEEEGGENYD